MNRDHLDALMDQMLRELLGGDRPREMTTRVMARVKEMDRARRRWWMTSVTGIAASLLIMGTLWVLWPKNKPVEEYPKMHAEGTYQLSGDGTLQRGVLFATDVGERATLTLGEYVHVKVEPETALTIGGARSEEKLFLEHGKVNVTVTKQKGTFELAVGPAIVHVTGTAFHASVEDDGDETTVEVVKKLRVKVDEGSVVVRGIGGAPVSLGSADGEKVFPISTGLVRPKAKPTAEPGVIQPGLLNGVGEGVRAGRGPLQVRNPDGIRPVPMPRGNTVQPVRPAQAKVVIIIEGNFETTGTLKRDGTRYVLDTERGAYTLFAQQNPLANLEVLVGKKVRVTWESSKVSKIQPVEEQRRGAGTVRENGR